MTKNLKNDIFDPPFSKKNSGENLPARLWTPLPLRGSADIKLGLKKKNLAGCRVPSGCRKPLNQFVPHVTLTGLVGQEGFELSSAQIAVLNENPMYPFLYSYSLCVCPMYMNPTYRLILKCGISLCLLARRYIVILE